MKHIVTTIAIAAIAATANAGPWNPQQVPKDARWMLHVDLDGLRATAVGKEMSKRLEKEKGRQFRAMKRMFSVNPLTDLASVTLCGPGAKGQAVALIEGRFDRAHIEDVIGGADDYATHPHGKFTVIEWTDKKKHQFAAFVSDHEIAISEQKALLHHALDVIGGDEASAAARPFLTAGPGKAVVVGFADLKEIEMGGKESKLLSKADGLEIAAAEVGGKVAVRLLIKTAEPLTAQRMRRVLDGMVAFGELAEIVGDEFDFEVSTAEGGNSVHARASVPVKDFLDFVDEHGKLGMR